MKNLKLQRLIVPLLFVLLAIVVVLLFVRLNKKKEKDNEQRINHIYVVLDNTPVEADTIDLYRGNGSLIASFSSEDRAYRAELYLGEEEKPYVYSHRLDKTFYFKSVGEDYREYADDARGTGELPPIESDYINGRSIGLRLDYETAEAEDRYYTDSGYELARGCIRFGIILMQNQTEAVPPENIFITSKWKDAAIENGQKKDETTILMSNIVRWLWPDMTIEAWSGKKSDENLIVSAEVEGLSKDSDWVLVIDAKAHELRTVEYSLNTIRDMRVVTVEIVGEPKGGSDRLYAEGYEELADTVTSGVVRTYMLMPKDADIISDRLGRIECSGYTVTVDYTQSEQ